MAVVKEAVDVATLSDDDMTLALALFGRTAADGGVEKLHNGYSGCNYRVRTGGGEQVLLKGSVDKPVEELSVQIALLRHLQPSDYPTAYPLPLVNGGYVARLENGMAVLMLEFLPGVPANRLIADTAATAEERAALYPLEAVLTTVGVALARLHSTPVPPSFRQYASGVGTKDSMFDPEALAALLALPQPLGTHPFLGFFGERIEAFRELVNDPSLPQGLMHCDCFLDNMLLPPPPAAGETLGLQNLSAEGAINGAVVLDWEDAAVGPLVQDLGIAVVGCCYGADGRLNPARLSALLGAYHAARPLTERERACLLPAMRGAALAVGFFRWRQFNVRHPELVQAKDAYMEMVHIVESLEGEGGDEALLQGVLRGLPAGEPSL
jgi:Ser/Thr protein kinase RdoA (MazF antagonist)